MLFRGTWLGSSAYTNFQLFEVSLWEIKKLVLIRVFTHFKKLIHCRYYRLLIIYTVSYL